MDEILLQGSTEIRSYITNCLMLEFWNRKFGFKKTQFKI